jgi:hypothetical protein
MRPLISLVLVLATFAAGCIDDSPAPAAGSSPAEDDPPLLEEGDDDATPWISYAGSPVGGTCATDADCDSLEGAGDGMCLAGRMDAMVFAPEGFCVVDDGSGEVCATDDDCGSGGQCVDSDGYRFCLPACINGACPGNQACLESFLGYPIDRPSCVPGNADAVDGDACDGVYECDEYSYCANSVEDPGGRCSTYGCTVGADETCNGGTCVAVNDYPVVGNVCFATCTQDTDCRAEDGYECFDPGVGAKYCRHSRVGDACASEADCGEGWTCKIEAGTTGSCTITGCATPGSTAGCSPGSICATVGEQNQCVDRCSAIGSACSEAHECTSVVGAIGGACMPDVTGPSVAITVPSASGSFATTASTVTLAGTATDVSSVALVTWSNAADASGGTATGTTAWSVTEIALVTGPNVITVAATDGAGNVDAAVITVTREPQ